MKPLVRIGLLLGLMAYSIILVPIEVQAEPSDPLSKLLQMTQGNFLKEDLQSLRKKQVRHKIIESEAIRYASQVAFAKRLNQLIDQAEAEQPLLDEIFDFHAIQQLATEQLDNAEELQSLAILFLPPVISHYSRVTAVGKEQKTYRNAASEYQIKQQARLTEQLLDWRFFLTQRPIDEPPNLISGALPKNSEEQQVWQRGVAEGWQLGLKQANQVMTDRLAQLMLTHKGMLDYVILVDQQIVKPPQVTLSTNASEINANKDHLAINVVRYQIRYPAEFNGDTMQWKSKLYSGELQMRRVGNHQTTSKGSLNVTAN